MSPAAPCDDNDLRPYAGRWVALVEGRFVAQGGTPRQALIAARQTRPKEHITLRYIPMHTPFPFSPLLDRIRQALPENAVVYLVGGAVRDALRGRASHDLDFAVQGDARQLARQVANALGAAYYPLHDDFDAGRVVLMDEAQRFMVDFVALHPEGLEADLRGRDFTLNAMAVDIRAPQQLLDPLGGAAALHQGVLHTCSPHSILDDPVRLLRAVRLAASLGLRIAPETRRQMRAAVPSLGKASVERLRFELLRILGGAQPAVSLRALDLLGALEVILPETAALKGVAQSPPHIYPVWEHTLAVIERLDALLRALGTQYDADTSANNLVLGHAVLRLGRYRQLLDEHLRVALTPDVSRRALLFFSALYHDAAKAETASVDENGRIRFFGHDAAGARLAASRTRALHMSREESEVVERTVRHHMRPLLLGQGGQMPSPRAVYRFFRQAGDAGVDVCLLSLADFLGTYGPAVPQEEWGHHVDVVRRLLEGWWERPQEVAPPRLLSGHDLIQNLNLKPGPQVGALLEVIREAQASGEVHTRDEALSLARERLQEIRQDELS